jgi:mannose-6-phosphate isomerase-like protein (cupin superfamily)
MKKTLILFAAAAFILAACASQDTAQSGPAAQSEPAAAQPEQKATVPGDKQLFKKAELETWDREKVAGGEGTLAGKFSFTRNDADPAWAIREIGWMTLAPGHSIGLHGHTDNDDAYIIVSGTGEFTDSTGKTFPVAARDVTVAHPGQKHALKNTGKEPLFFLDIVSKNVNPDPDWAKEPQFFKAAELAAWDRQNVANGKGKLAGKFSYNRNDKKTFPLYEIGWMTLAPGDSIGLHEHADNEDAYIIVSGTGEFAGTDEQVFPVGEGDITIARPTQKHSLANTGKTDLIFLDIVAR